MSETRPDANKYQPPIFCVDCGGLVKNLRCGACHRVYSLTEGIPCLLSTEDIQSEMFQKYFKNYSRIAQDDLANDASLPFLEAQAQKGVGYCGRLDNKAVLEIGPGKGSLVRRVARQDVAAVDISVAYLMPLQEMGVFTLVANAEKLPFRNEFDVVFASEVLEHVLCPERVLWSMQRALKSNGIAVVRVPLNEDITQYSPQAGYKYDFLHLRSFTKPMLVRMVEDCGLKVRRCHYDGFQGYRIRPLPILIRAIIDILGLSWRRRFERVHMHRLIRDIPLLGTLLFYMRIFSLCWRGGVNGSELDEHVSQLPNWLGRLFFRPLNIAVVAEKVTGTQAYGSPRTGSIDKELQLNLRLPRWKWQRLLELLDHNGHNPVIADIAEDIKHGLRGANNGL